MYACAHLGIKCFEVGGGGLCIPAAVDHIHNRGVSLYVFLMKLHTKLWPGCLGWTPFIFYLTPPPPPLVLETLTNA